MAKTLAESLEYASIDWKTLHNRYHPLLNLVKEMIGIIPNCDKLFGNMAPGFRTYNLLVPNLFNLPHSVFGSKSFKASMGLAMYASSKAACDYCTAHTCSFALRRGASSESIAGSRTAKEQAVVTLAERLAQIPSALTLDDVDAVRQFFTPSETEWLVFSISMMGFLNKFMNVTGVELEQDAINDTTAVLSRTGWKAGIHARTGHVVTAPHLPPTDNLLTYLRIIRHAPGAIMWEKKWTRGVPSDYTEVAKYLKQHTGSSFPVLNPIKEGRVLRAVTTALCNNLDETTTVTGLNIKMYSGYIYSTLVQNAVLQAEVKDLSAKLAPALNTNLYRQLEEVALLEIPADTTSCNKLITSLQQQFSITEKEAAVLLLAMASSYSPSAMNEAVIKTSLQHIEPAGVVEIVVWLSVLQLLNRLSSYYSVTKAYEHL